MLPWPTWHSTGLMVEPSVACDACGFHTTLELGEPDQSHRCMATWEIDGRWCDRMIGHPGTHQYGMVSWGTYTRSEPSPDAADD
jgi:hypothetical protein